MEIMESTGIKIRIQINADHFTMESNQKDGCEEDIRITRIIHIQIPEKYYYVGQI